MPAIRFVQIDTTIAKKVPEDVFKMFITALPKAQRIRRYALDLAEKDAVRLFGRDVTGYPVCQICDRIVVPGLVVSYRSIDGMVSKITNCADCDTINDQLYQKVKYAPDGITKASVIYEAFSEDCIGNSGELDSRGTWPVRSKK